MSSESTSCVSSHLNSIEADFESSRALNDDLVEKFFAELMKFENGSSAIKEFTWMFGLGENDRHIVESKECRKVYLIDFNQCRKFLNKFISSQDWKLIAVESGYNKALKRHSNEKRWEADERTQIEKKENSWRKNHLTIKNVWVTNAKISRVAWFTVERLSPSMLIIFLSDVHAPWTQSPEIHSENLSQ